MFETIQENWTDIMTFLRNDLNMTDVSYKTWILPLKPLSLDGDTLTVLFPGDDPGNKYNLDYINRKYIFFVHMAILEKTGLNLQIELVSSENEKQTADNTARPAIISPSAPSSNLNPRYTFDTFVVGSNNKMAHAASLAVAESPAEIYNPLFIYGGVGLGKTHLMQAIANFVLKNNLDAKVMYVTCESFTNELIDAIRNKTTTEFREKYRSNDVLLIDDIQFIAGKESTQEEFFHTFNALREAKRQIIISSDRPPKEIETLEERLRSRFEWGLTVDIQSPDYETRMAILRKKEELEGYNIDNEVIKYIANNIKSNIRELEGALTKIVALSRLDNRDITIELAEEALKDLILPDQPKEITPEIIIRIVSDHFGVNALDITSSKRNREFVYPRQIVMYLCREMTNAPLQLIGKYLGNRDHTTILHGHDKIAADLEKGDSESLRTTIDVIKKKINPS